MTAEACARQIRSLDEVVRRAMTNLALHERAVEELEARLSAARSSLESRGYLDGPLPAPAPGATHERPLAAALPRLGLATS